MRIIEGSVAEIVEYQRLTRELVDAVMPEGSQAGSLGETPDLPGVEDLVQRTATSEDRIREHVESRARNPETRRRVSEYLAEVRALGTLIEAGESERTRDGQSNYLMVRDAGPRRFGAVAYIRPSNGGLSLRLKPDDVAEYIGDVVKVRKVRSGNEYAVICPLKSDEAVAIAVELTKLALEKVRR